MISRKLRWILTPIVIPALLLALALAFLFELPDIFACASRDTSKYLFRPLPRELDWYCRAWLIAIIFAYMVGRQIEAAWNGYELEVSPLWP